MSVERFAHEAAREALLSFRDEALCVGLGSGIDFYAMHHDEQQRAIKICLRCPVREECLRYALEACEEFGVWGGYTATDRRRIRKQMRIMNTDHIVWLPNSRPGNPTFRADQKG